MNEPPIVRRIDRRNAHQAAAQIQPARESCRERVLNLLLEEADWVPGEIICEVGGSEGLRRLREWRAMSERYIVLAKPPPSGKGRWWYKVRRRVRRVVK